MAFQPKAAFEEIARGDRSAYEFLEAFFIWCHIHDDLIDRDKMVPADLAAWAPTNLIFTLARNEFFKAHQADLLPVILTSALAYIASEDRRQHPDVLERLTAQVLKSEYVNVILMVAFLVGGWEHALTMSRKHREYSFDAEPVNV